MIEELTQFVKSEINTRGARASEPEFDSGIFTIRFKHPAIDMVIGSVSYCEKNTTEELAAKVTEALKAASKQKIAG